MCTAQHYLLSMCILQLLTIIERQIFDFLGYMWAPILANFFHIIFVIFGIFGSYLFRSNYLITYTLWSVFWCGWNIFLICFYSNVGILDRDSDLLNLGTGSVSWFEVNGYGCRPNYSTNITSDDPFRLVRPENVDDCFVEYPTIEIIHSAIQLILTIFGLIGAIRVALIIYKGENGIQPKAAQRPSLYSIEFSPPVDTILQYDNIRTGNSTDLSPKPMTPRRVKRRSVMTRGTTSRQSGTSRRSHTSNRTSTRASRRKFQPNPVAALIDHPRAEPPKRNENLTLTESNLKYLNTDIVPSVVNKSFRKSSNFIQNIAPDPIYYNMSTSTTFFEPSWNSSTNLATSSEQSMQQPPQQPQRHHHHQGHFNPTYQHSTPNLNNNQEMVDELYNNRPPSVRSSYSNFHGSRPLSMGHAGENVFAVLNQNAGRQGGGNGHHGHMTHSRSVPQAIPQVPPHRQRCDSRESVRSMAFLNNGPPAYNLNYHTPPDSNSETTM